MSKYLIILLYLLPIISIATPLNESFTSTTFPPIGWVVLNRDGGTETWRRDTVIKRTPPACALSSFESNLRVDDWLITPRFLVQIGDSFKFWYRRIFGNFDTIRIKLSTTNNYPDSFMYLISEFRITYESFHEKSISIGDFVNESVYVAIIHNAPHNQAKIYIDDIMTCEGTSEIKDVGVDTILYPNTSFLMRPRGVAFQPKAKIKNYSNTPQNNIPVVCSIFGDGSILRYVNYKEINSLLIDSSQIVVFDSFAPIVAEVCTVKIRTLLANDINPTNDRKTKSTQIIAGQYTGGPDAGFTYWIDSDTTGGPIYSWTDISLTGTPLPAGGSNFSWPTPIDFAFNFYGEPKTHFCYSTKGFISFDTLLYSFGINMQIPCSDLPNNIVAPFWDDLYTNNGRHQSFGIAPNRYKIIQWNSVFITARQDTVIFQLILHENGDIIFQYNRCDNRYNLGQGQTATVGIENANGSTGLQYLYNGTPQGNLLSSGRAIRFYRSCHDVTPDSILTSQVGLGDTVNPRVLVKNIGTSTESFLSIFNIFDRVSPKAIAVAHSKSLIYVDTLEVTDLLPATSCTLSFDEWIAPQYGTYSVKAWTTLDNDFNRANDTCYQDLEVSIAAPALLNPNNGFATNIMSVSFDWTDITGATRYNFQVINLIDTIIANSQYGPVNFPEGIYCWRVRAGTESRWGFWSETYAFIIDITPPSAPILFSPTQNCTLYQPYPNFFWSNVAKGYADGARRIDEAVMYNLLVYTSAETIINRTLVDTNYLTSSAFANGVYLWKVRCQDLATNWSNFSSPQTFFMSYPVWERKADVPEMNSYRPVRDGGCLVSAGNKLYALKGNNTQDFYEYDIGTNQWSRKCSIPYLTTDSGIVKRKVRTGAALVYTGNLIFALKGNKTREFWSYDPIMDNWICKKSVPSLRGIKDGSSLTYHNGFIYCLVGASSSYEFYRYDISQDTWVILNQAPEGRNHNRFKSGSCIVYAGNNKIYALKGSARINEFYCYDINTNSWQAKDSLPCYHPSIRKKTKISYGGAMCYDGQNTIYAIKGGGKNEFWKWNTTTNQWSAKDTIPRLYKRSVPKNGASLCYADSKVWLLKGNRTRELWAYLPITKDKNAENAEGKNQNRRDIRERTSMECNDDVVACKNTVFALQSAVSANRCPHKIVVPLSGEKSVIVNYTDNVFIRFYDVQGRLVKSVKQDWMSQGAHSAKIMLDDLPKGVYIIIVEEY